ncbi:MAG: dihydroorotase [Candidatus Kuenenbacteria bacterium]
MIDPHVHCRDWTQNHKETISHALSVAEKAGLSGIFDMPNTNPLIISREFVKKRLDDAKKTKSPVFYGLYVGITSNPFQIKEAVMIWKEFFPKVVGLKMFAGHSVGNLGIISENEQKLVYQILSNEDYKGVLVVHCEKESFLKPDLWDPLNPVSHSYARPIEAEVESIRDQIKFAKNYQFKGTLHIAHISVPKSVELVDNARKRKKIKISCGLTPHHCSLDYESIPKSSEGLLYKVNPPLRDKKSVKKMLKLLKQGKIDWIETDHAPHTLKEKLEKPYMSGFPGLPYYPCFINFLKKQSFSDMQIKNLTYNNICNIFGFNFPKLKISFDLGLNTEYEVDVYKDKR